MAQVRLTPTRREVCIEGISGELVRRFDIGAGEHYREVLRRHGLRLFGHRYHLADGDGGEVFMVRVDPVEEELYPGRVAVGLDHFHHQVVVWVEDRRVPFLDEQTARRLATAITRAADDARNRWR